jgi:hypothetical protein
VTRPEAPSLRGRFARLLLHPRLGLRLALLATLLVSPSLFIGFHLDDYVHRYVLSDLPGARDLLRVYESPFGIANGEAADNQLQIEQGYAPWWTHPRLLVSLFRPLSVLSHQLDVRLWPESALLQHAHSLLFHFLLVLAAASLFRTLMGLTTVAGLAALLYAFDHAHGFAVGWIANRNAVVAALLGVLALRAHALARTKPSLYALLAPLLLGAALLAGEGAIAIFGYLVAYALFVDTAPWRRRVLSLVPHVLVIAAWRAAYFALDRGARCSGLYLDPAQEPLQFLGAALQRVPLLLLGQLGLPPAEAHMFAPEPLKGPLLALAFMVTAAFVLACGPLLRTDRMARFWALGLFGSLLSASSTHPNNRLLYFAGLGAMGLCSLVWHGLVAGTLAFPSRFALQGARTLLAGIVGFHLLLSPLLLPLTACSVALTAQTKSAVQSALALGEQRDLVVVAAPDFYDVKLVPIVAALERRPAPVSLRALSFGPTPLRVARSDPRTLELTFEGGLLATPLLELYRARSLTLPVGSRVELHGLSIEVTSVTREGLVEKARFRFEHALEDARYRFVSWNGERFAPFAPPEPGRSVPVAPARLRFGL